MITAERLERKAISLLLLLFKIGLAVKPEVVFAVTWSEFNCSMVKSPERASASLYPSLFNHRMKYNPKNVNRRIGSST